MSLPLAILGTALPALVVAAMAANTPPARAAAVFFFTVLIPGLQVASAAFFGWRAAFALGLAFLLLAIRIATQHPLPLEIQPVQWPVRFTSLEQKLRATLARPPSSRSNQWLAEGGRAVLFICRAAGEVGELDVSLGGTVPALARQPAPADCWQQFLLPPDVLADAGTVVEVLIQPRKANPDGVAQLIGGYTRPRDRGGRSGGAAFFDGRNWSSADLSPSEPGAQTGRYFVELRIVDAAGRVREVWY